MTLECYNVNYSVVSICINLTVTKHHSSELKGIGRYKYFYGIHFDDNFWTKGQMAATKVSLI